MSYHTTIYCAKENMKGAQDAFASVGITTGEFEEYTHGAFANVESLSENDVGRLDTETSTDSASFPPFVAHLSGLYGEGYMALVWDGENYLEMDTNRDFNPMLLVYGIDPVKDVLIMADDHDVRGYFKAIDKSGVFGEKSK